MLVTKPSLGTLPPPDEPTALTWRNRTAWVAGADKRLVASGATRSPLAPVQRI